MSKPTTETRNKFQAIKKPIEGGLGPYQIECSRGGGFVPGVTGLNKESMEKMMNSLVKAGALIVSNEWFSAPAGK